MYVCIYICIYVYVAFKIQSILFNKKLRSLYEKQKKNFFFENFLKEKKNSKINIFKAYHRNDVCRNNFPEKSGNNYYSSDKKTLGGQIIRMSRIESCS